MFKVPARVSAAAAAINNEELRIKNFREPKFMGRSPGKTNFSTVWKKVFHSVEKNGRFFHTMEKSFANFPHNGKMFLGGGLGLGRAGAGR
jgi:hypothetical protein